MTRTAGSRKQNGARSATGARFEALVSAILAAALMAGVGTAHAQQKPTRLLIFAAGGPVDFVGRTLAVKLSPLLGTPVVVEARPGASGVVAAQAVANSEPDGSTLLLASSGLLTITPTITKDLPYDTDKALVPVARIVVNATALVIAAATPATNVREFVAFGSAQKEPLIFGSPGIGNIGQIWIATFKEATRLDITTVPYKGIAPVLIDVLGGRAVGAFADMPAVLSHIKGGKLKALGLVGTRRNAAVPDIPTIHEQGYTGVDALSWYGVLAPAKTPPAIIAKLNEALTRAMADRELTEKLAASGVASASSSPDEFRQLIQNDRARLAKIIRELKMVAE
jgi:tripartite-type tricarboxylate transporter receptor subunit TctC